VLDAPAALVVSSGDGVAVGCFEDEQPAASSTAASRAPAAYPLSPLLITAQFCHELSDGFPRTVGNRVGASVLAAIGHEPGLNSQYL
jgi:hypothetical protein